MKKQGTGADVQAEIVEAAPTKLSMVFISSVIGLGQTLQE